MLACCKHMYYILGPYFYFHVVIEDDAVLLLLVKYRKKSDVSVISSQIDSHITGYPSVYQVITLSHSDCLHTSEATIKILTMTSTHHNVFYSIAWKIGRISGHPSILHLFFSQKSPLCAKRMPKVKVIEGNTK